MLVRQCAINFGGAQWLASTVRRLSVRGLPKERSSQGKPFLRSDSNVGWGNLGTAHRHRIRHPRQP